MSAIQKMPATLSICVCLNKETHTYSHKRNRNNCFQIWCLEGLQQKRMTKEGLERELENEVRIQEIHYKEELRQ